mgnify:FL=1
MRALILTLLSFVLLPATGGAQEALVREDSLAIAEAMDRQESAWNRGDLDAFMETYWKSDNLQFIGANGPTYGWQATLDNYRRRYPDRAAMGRLSFSILRMDQRSATVVSLIGKFHLRRRIGDLEGYFLLIWQKIEGQWRIVADHTS